MSVPARITPESFKVLTDEDRAIILAEVDELERETITKITRKIASSIDSVELKSAKDVLSLAQAKNVIAFPHRQQTNIQVNVPVNIDLGNALERALTRAAQGGEGIVEVEPIGTPAGQDGGRGNDD